MTGVRGVKTEKARKNVLLGSNCLLKYPSYTLTTGQGQELEEVFIPGMKASGT